MLKSINYSYIKTRKINLFMSLNINLIIRSNMYIFLILITPIVLLFGYCVISNKLDCGQFFPNDYDDDYYNEED